MPLVLPPLNAFRAFEAAARGGSYVAAAEELDVSPAAVSQQVRKLEGFLGKRLFMRFNNRVVLTDAGQAIYAGASDTLQSISALTEHVMSGGAKPRLVISALSSVALRWLEPRLVAFALEQRAVRVDLRIEDDPVDFARHNIDLRICYGSTLYPEMHVIHLHQDEVLPLCSPAYLRRNPSARTSGMGGVPDDDLIHTNWGPSFVSNPTWHAWFAKSGVTRAGTAYGYQVGMSSLALDLARDGLGVALGQRMLAHDDLAAGRLITLSSVAVALRHPYCLVHPHGKSRKDGLRPLIEWLVKDPGGTK
jgi:LysR family transcriptional regulator, glycine cleavage system transcriptional activator